MNKAFKGRRRAAHSSARALGWFGIGLGLVEVLAPRAVAKFLGMEGSETALRLCGLREIGSGLGILISRDPTPWVWSRVAGDAIDVAVLGAGFSDSWSHKGALSFAAASVLTVTAADVATGGILSELRAKANTKYRDYSDRSGLRREAQRTQLA